MSMVLGRLLVVIGGTAGFLIEVFSSFWLASAHGVGWVILAWVTFLPLIVIPFLAGYGLAFAATLVISYVGSVIVEGA